MKSVGWSLIPGLAGILFNLSCSNDAESPLNCSTEGPVLTLVESGDTECNEQSGFIKVAATGGSGNYQFKLDGGAFQAASEFTGLGAGTYLVTLRDENTCEQTLSVNIINVDGVNIALSSTDAGCKESEGSVTATAEGGEAPYTFRIGGGAFGSENIFLNLSRGDYNITVKDNTGCEASSTIKVKSGVSFESDIKPIIETSCAVSNCHNGNRSPDLRQFNNIKSNAAKIKELTGKREMPKEGSLTQNQIDAIACWVDDGAPAN